MKNLKKLFFLIFTVTTSFLCWGNEVVISLEKTDDGDLIASDVVDFPGKSKDVIFAKAVIATREILSGDNDSLEDIEFNDKKIYFIKTISNGKGGGKILDKEIATYKFAVTVTPSSGALLLTVDDMWVSYKDKGILQKTTPIGALKEDNSRQMALKKEFVNLLSNFLNQYVEDIQNADYQKVTHWEDIEKGKIVKGMTQYEVLILKGKPRNESKNGSRVKWMYANDNVIIFTDNVVTSIIE